MPMPTTTTVRSSAAGGFQPAEIDDVAGQSASARMPASLRSGAEPSPGHTRSFGHLRRGANPATASTAAGRRDRDGHRREVHDRRRAGAAGSTAAAPAPGGAVQVRPGAAPAGGLVVGHEHDPLGLALAGQRHRVGVGGARLGHPAHVGEPRARGRPRALIWHVRPARK